MGPEGSKLKIAEDNQDFFVLDLLNYKKNGFFVDLGASDGVTASNTFLLEKFYKWEGICVDPNPVTIKSLSGARDSHICDLAVWESSGQVLPFRYLKDQTEFYGWNLRAGLNETVVGLDSRFGTYNVFTISLNDLLELYNAPYEIDYISMDLEGSELNVLRSFDFSENFIKIWTIEHSNDIQEQEIFNIMDKHGYVLKTKLGHENWYVHKSII